MYSWIIITKYLMVWVYLNIIIYLSLIFKYFKFNNILFWFQTNFNTLYWGMRKQILNSFFKIGFHPKRNNIFLFHIYIVICNIFSLFKMVSFQQNRIFSLFCWFFNYILITNQYVFLLINAYTIFLELFHLFNEINI